MTTVPTAPARVTAAITIARPVGSPNGVTVALMKRVVVRGGRTVAVVL